MTTQTKVVITDCDHDAIEFERGVATERGAALQLSECVTEDDVIAAAAEADAIVVQYAPITARVLAALPGLKAVGRYGVGVDTVDVEAATEAGVAVCNVPDYGVEDVSDHALAMALSLVRGLPQLDRNLRAGSIDLGPVRPLHRFSQLTFGLVGLGRIGAATARKAKAVGFTTIGTDPLIEPGGTAEDGIPVVDFDELFRRSDIVSLHVPLSDATHHLVDDAVLARMPAHSILINTCRGGVVDTEAVLRALQSGHLAGAGLDVLEQEPLDVDHPIAALPQTIFTPHAAWHSDESYGELKTRVVKNVLDVCAGVTPRDILNPSVLSGTDRHDG